MSALADTQCVPCRGNIPALSDRKVQELLPQVPGWEVGETGGVKRLKRVYRFKNFAAALAFSNRVGEIAEAEGHHPAILTEWGKVTVSWWTHHIQGLHHNDFIMAARTDQLETGSPV